MYCPKCGSAQINDEISFCRDCGFSLADVAEALGSGGTENRKNIETGQKAPRGLGSGIVVMTVAVLVMFLTMVFFTPEPSGAVQFNFLLGFLAFLVGLGVAVYSGWFRSVNKAESSQIGQSNLDQGNIGEKRLAPANPQEVANEYFAPRQRVTTTELADPESVTIATTKLLSRDGDD